MKCPDPSLLVDLALDDELDTARLAEFERHLQSCPDCAVAYARKKALKGALCAQLPRHRAPSTLVQRICKARKRFGNEAAPTIARQEAPLFPRMGTLSGAEFLHRLAATCKAPVTRCRAWLEASVTPFSQSRS
jgi:anti-sigma factor RsiW